jgi:tetratricopeptide (TPR) repeat protein
LEDAEAQTRKVWAIAERMGLNYLMGPTLFLLSNILAYRGCLDDARDFGGRAIKWTNDNNDQYFGSYARLYMSVIEHLAKNYSSAEQHARDAMEMLANNPTLRPFALALLARAFHGQGRIVEALSYARDAYEQLEALGQVQDGESTIRLALAECLAASSDRVTAKHVIEKAIEWLRKRSSSIDIPDWRRSFLTRIPEHACILDLARELGIAEVKESDN